jgi:hypothetical protein
MLRPHEVQFVHDDSFGMTMSMLAGINNTNVMTQNLSMVGKYVQAITARDGVATGFIEGRVEFIDFSGSTPFLVVGDQRVHLGEIISVSSGPKIIGNRVGFYYGGQFLDGVIELSKFVMTMHML